MTENLIYNKKIVGSINFELTLTDLSQETHFHFTPCYLTIIPESAEFTIDTDFFK